MQLMSNHLYHIYNQGNNREDIFLKDADYQDFLNRYKTNVEPFCETLAYCLMPNHFHFLVNINEKSIEKIKIGSLFLTKISNGFRLLQSGYASAFNQENKRIGALFRPKIKFKILHNEDESYAFTCFQYIHQNPIKANLVDKIEYWKFSSFNEYHNQELVEICHKDMATKLLSLNFENFYLDSYQEIDKEKLKNIWAK